MDAKPQPTHRWFLIFLLVLVPVLFLIGWSQASLSLRFIHPQDATATFLLTAVSAFVWVLFAVFALILARILLKLHAERRLNKLGAHFKTRMVAAFLVLSVLPVCFLFLFSYGLINRSIDKWFAIPFNTVRQDAAAITGQVAAQSEQQAMDNAAHLASLPRMQHLLASGQHEALTRFLERIRTGMGLSEVVCLDASGRVAARSGPMEISPAELQKAFPQAAKAPAPSAAFRIPVKGADSDLFVAARGITTPDGGNAGIVIVTRRLPLSIQRISNQIEQQADRYDELSRQKKALKRLYLSILLLTTLLILFAATWFANFFAKQVTIPVQALAEATHAVSEGNLGWRITTRAGAELGSLIGLFNEMTRQLQESRLALEKAAADLTQVNRDMEERTNTTEAILQNVPAGVISFNPQGVITQANSAAERMFGKGPIRPGSGLPNLFSADEAAEVSKLFRRARRQGVVNRQLAFGLGQRRALVSVTLSAVSAQHGAVGFVMVIEDLTDLAKAQRSEAWQEVAQRIAHEIKNPLTPIRLSSGRIQRLVGRAPSGSAPLRLLASVSESAALIEKEVSTLETLVEAFSSYARFPASMPVPSDLNRVIENALGVFDGRLSKISLHRELSPGLPAVRVDPEQMKRVVVNLIDNAAEAIENAPARDIWVQTTLDPDRESVCVIIADNGPGISLDAKERLFLPYFSTKQRGTGLGLAIVSRIISEHNGSIRVEENWPEGTRFIIDLPLECSSALKTD